MKNNIEEKFALLRRVTLSDEERRAMRRAVAAHADQYAFQKSGLFSIFKIHTIKTLIPALIVVLLLAVSGGTAAAASEGSLPGDALYPVKTSIVEPVSMALTFSAEQKANLKLEIAERRLDEAEKLATQDRLSAEQLAKIENNFNKQETHIEALVARFEADGKHELAARLSSNVEAALKAHASILQELQARASAKAAAGGAVPAQPLDSLLTTVNAKLSTTVKARTESEDGVAKNSRADTQEAALGRKNASQQKIDEVQKYIDKIESAEAKAQATTKIQAARDTLAQGDTKFAAGSYGEAFVLYQAANRTATEAKLLAISTRRLNIDIKTKSSSEDTIKANGKSSSGDKNEEEDSSDDNKGSEHGLELHSLIKP
jgi:hypothetical protein